MFSLVIQEIFPVPRDLLFLGISYFFCIDHKGEGGDIDYTNDDTGPISGKH